MIVVFRKKRTYSFLISCSGKYICKMFSRNTEITKCPKLKYLNEHGYVSYLFWCAVVRLYLLLLFQHYCELSLFAVLQNCWRQVSCFEKLEFSVMSDWCESEIHASTCSAKLFIGLFQMILVDLWYLSLVMIVVGQLIDMSIFLDRMNLMSSNQST